MDGSSSHVLWLKPILFQQYKDHSLQHDENLPKGHFISHKTTYRERSTGFSSSFVGRTTRGIPQKKSAFLLVLISLFFLCRGSRYRHRIPTFPQPSYTSPPPFPDADNQICGKQGFHPPYSLRVDRCGASSVRGAALTHSSGVLVVHSSPRSRYTRLITNFIVSTCKEARALVNLYNIPSSVILEDVYVTKQILAQPRVFTKKSYILFCAQKSVVSRNVKVIHTPGSND